MALEYRLRIAESITLEGRPADPHDCYLLGRTTGIGEGRDRREQVEPAAAGDGDYLGPASRGGLMVTAEGTIVAPTRELLRSKRAALLAALEPVDPADPFLVELLDRTGDPAGGLAAMMRVAVPLAAPDSADGAYWTAPYQFAVRSESYGWSGPGHTVTIEPASASSGRAYSKAYPMAYAGGTGLATLVTNAGDVTAWPVLRIYGETVAPLVENLTTGEALAFPALTISAGTFLEIDPRSRTAYLNGDPSQSRYNDRDAAASSWWGLVPGANAIRFTDFTHSASAELVVIYSDTFA